MNIFVDYQPQYTRREDEKQAVTKRPLLRPALCARATCTKDVQVATGHFQSCTVAQTNPTLDLTLTLTPTNLNPLGVSRSAGPSRGSAACFGGVSLKTNRPKGQPRPIRPTDCQRPAQLVYRPLLHIGRVHCCCCRYL